MTWEYSYDKDSDKTAIYWNETEQAKIDGKITSWKNGYPATNAAREAVAKTIQKSGTDEQLQMLFELNYGFKEKTEDSKE